jgi:hypothetical protein
MVIDAVRYLGNQLDVEYYAGWSRFAEDARQSGYRYLDQPAWDWLPMMCYEFLFLKRLEGGDCASVSILVISDTGYIDAAGADDLKSETAAFAAADKSHSKVAFVIHRGHWDPLPFIKEKATFRSFVASDGTLPADLAARDFGGKCYDLGFLTDGDKIDQIVGDIVETARMLGIPVGRKG